MPGPKSVSSNHEGTGQPPPAGASDLCMHAGGSRLCLGAILDSINDAILVHDASTAAILDCNDTACRMFGYTREELLRQSIASLSSGEEQFDQPRAVQFLERARAMGGAQTIWRARRRDGSLFWVEANARFRTTEKLDRFFVTARDISERIKMETERERSLAALRESDERFRLLLSRVPAVAVQGYTPEGVIHYWNDASEQLYGYKASEVLGRNLVDLIVPSEMRDTVRAMIAAMAATGRAAPAAELELMRKDGSPVPVYSSHGVVRTQQAGTELYCFDIDLTERKRAEAGRLELQRRMLSAEKLESLGVLAGGVAHDFNNLLTAILGNLDLALMEIPMESDQAATLTEARSAAAAAADLTRQMLAYSGRGRFEIEAIDLSAFVHSQMSHLRYAMPDFVTLDTDLPPRLPPIKADPDQLRQVLRNLFSNALESVEQTQVRRVSIRTGACEYDETALERNRTANKSDAGVFAYLEVEDTGSGIPDDALARAFDPFFSTKFAGRGLGLAVVLGVARAHHAAIFMKSALGAGTTVRVAFPVSIELPAARPAPATSGPMVLLVDDDPQIGALLARTLRQLGVRSTVAVSGEDAIAHFSTSVDEFDAAIVDLTLPGMDGWECVQSLRRQRPDLPVIISTGTASSEVDPEFLRDGIAAVLPKPFSTEQICSSLEIAGLQVNLPH